MAKPEGKDLFKKIVFPDVGASERSGIDADHQELTMAEI